MSDEKLPVNYCLECRLVHPPMIPHQQAQAENMKAFLLRVGKLAHCKGCNASIYWVTHLNGKTTPYTEAGLNHFIDCPQREHFKTR